MSIEMKWMGEEVSEKIKRELEVSLGVAVSVVAKRTSSQLPKQSGALASSVKYYITKNEYEIIAYWGSDLPYASEVEFGTRDRAPNGTWRRVIEFSKPEIRNFLTKGYGFEELSI